MLTKYQSKKEKEIISELTARYKTLSDLERSELLRLKCRNELISFIFILSGKTFKPYPVHQYVVDFVQKIADDDPGYEYTTISLPPRTGKSTIISQYLPAFQLGRNPLSNHIMASHTLELTQRNMSRIIEIMSSSTFKKIFPECKLPKTGVKTKKFRTISGGGCLATTPKSKVSGFDAGTMEHSHFPGLIILDDLLSNGDSPAELESAWNFVSVELLTRGLPNKSFISMGTRYHASDVTGRLLDSSPDLWKSINIPALCLDPENDPLNRKMGESHWEEKFPVEELKIIRSIQTEEQFNTVYQGIPKGSKGNYIYLEDFIYTEKVFKGLSFFSIDTNAKGGSSSDYNCVCIWKLSGTGLDVIELIDVFYQKCDFSRLLINMEKLIQFHNPSHIVIESRASGDSLLSMLQREYQGVSIHGYNPRVDKIARMQLAAPSIKRGKVVIYQNIANWADYEKQLTTFPYAKNDDMADAFSLGINFYNEVMNDSSFFSSLNGFVDQMKVIKKKEPIDTSLLTSNYLSGKSDSANDYYSKHPEEVSSFL